MFCNVVQKAAFRFCMMFDVLFFFWKDEQAQTHNSSSAVLPQPTRWEKKKKAVHSKKSNLHPLLGATDIREGFLLFLLFNHRWYTCSWSGPVISSHRLSFGATAVQQRGHDVGKLAYTEPLDCSVYWRCLSSQDSDTPMAHKHITPAFLLHLYLYICLCLSHTVWIVGQGLMWRQCVRCAVAVEAAACL